MNLSLKGKTAVVTGAAKGIGRSIAEKMAESGAAVGIIDFDKATGFAAQEEFTAKGYKCVFAAADVSNYESLVQAKQQLVDAFGKIDILVINAGVSRKHTIAEIEPAEWERVISINLSGSFYTVKAFYDCFADKKPEDEGRIIFVTSGFRYYRNRRRSTLCCIQIRPAWSDAYGIKRIRQEWRECKCHCTTCYCYRFV